MTMSNGIPRNLTKLEEVFEMLLESPYWRDVLEEFIELWKLEISPLDTYEDNPHLLAKDLYYSFNNFHDSDEWSEFIKDLTEICLAYGISF